VTLVVATCVVCEGGTVDPVYPGNIFPAEPRDPAIYFSSSRRVAGYLPIVVALSDVLEHVPRPVEILQKIRSWLAVDGWLPQPSGAEARSQTFAPPPSFPPQ
jgi:hypothetical protein